MLCIHTQRKKEAYLFKNLILLWPNIVNFIWYFLNSHLSETWETDMSFVFLLLILTAETRQSSVSWSKKSHIRVPLYKLTWEQDWCTHWCKKIITITLKNVFLFTKTQVYLWVKWNRYLHIQINISVFMSK